MLKSGANALSKVGSDMGFKTIKELVEGIPEEERCFEALFVAARLDAENHRPEPEGADEHSEPTEGELYQRIAYAMVAEGFSLGPIEKEIAITFAAVCSAENIRKTIRKINRRRC